MSQVPARPALRAPLVRVARDVEALAKAVAGRFVDALAFWLKDEWVGTAHAVFTGGLVNDAMLEALSDSYRRREIDWAKVHAWWTDEGFLPRGHIGRHETKALAAGFGRIGFDPRKVHAVPGLDEHPDERVEAAAADYARLLTAMAPHGRAVPMFDVLLASVGPRGEVAGLLPGHAALTAREPATAETGLTEGPAARVTMTLPTLNAATRVWLLASGADSAEAVGQALRGAHPAKVPAAGVRGGLETVWWLDAAAAAEVPDELRYAMPPPVR